MTSEGIYGCVQYAHKLQYPHIFIQIGQQSRSIMWSQFILVFVKNQDQ